jgi:RNA recognition motif-containing protein
VTLSLFFFFSFFLSLFLSLLGLLDLTLSFILLSTLSFLQWFEPWRKRLRDQYEQNNEGFAKRPRVEDAIPSKVLHVRGLPPDATEAELTQLCLPFGRVAGVLLLSSKGQAFVQMEDLSQAMALVPYYNSVHAIIRGTVVFFQFSNRTEITSNAHSAVVRFK